VGDLALYLVTRGLKASDLEDPEKAASVDFPESVVGLLRGDLGTCDGCGLIAPNPLHIFSIH